MNIIMSGALPNHYPYRGKPKVDSKQHQSPGVSTPTSPQSPLDFIDRIPFSEIKLSGETLGSGSFGTVFKGRWRGRKVAVKQFKTREERDSFLVEVKQLSNIKHANIVTLHGATWLPDTAYLIMEYAEGGSLNNLLHECKKQEYDLRHACSWARQAARGVAYLHGIRPKPIMHRDLKPANLLLFSRGEVLKICDFGTACDVKTQMTNNTGSPSYMAPEVFSTSSYLESGDVFSWGIIFWEILVRLHPYNKSYYHPFQILWSVNQGTRPAVIETCPRHIWNLITSSWNKDPKKRPSMEFIAEEMNCIFKLVDRKNQRQTPGGTNRVRQLDNVGRCDTKFQEYTPPMSPMDSVPLFHSSQPQTSSHHQQVSREQSFQSRTSSIKRREALNQKISLLKEITRELEDSDKIHEKVAFDEFDKLKLHVKARRHRMLTTSRRQQYSS
jgi:mitogen-activated protein kinase kinase kinase 7